MAGRCPLPAGRGTQYVVRIFSEGGHALTVGVSRHKSLGGRRGRPAGRILVVFLRVKMLKYLATGQVAW